MKGWRAPEIHLERARSVSARQSLGKESERATLSASTGSQGGTEVSRPGAGPPAPDRPRGPRYPWGRPRHAALKFCQTPISRRLPTSPHFPRVNYNSPPNSVLGRNAAPLGPLWSLLLLRPGEPLGLGARRRCWAGPGAALRPARDSGSAARAGARTGQRAVTFRGTRATIRTPGAASAWIGLGE